MNCYSGSFHRDLVEEPVHKFVGNVWARLKYCGWRISE